VSLSPRSVPAIRAGKRFGFGAILVAGTVGGSWCAEDPGSWSS
jgi:hypothetical protein